MIKKLKSLLSTLSASKAEAPKPAKRPLARVLPALPDFPEDNDYRRAAYD